MREHPSIAAPDTDPDAAAVRVIYVAGYGRSGSTLLDIALGNAPGVFGLGELTALSRHVWVKGEYCACGQRVPDCHFWSRVVERWSGFDEERIDPRMANLRPAQRHVEALPGLGRLPHRARSLHARETGALLSAIAREVASEAREAAPFLVDSSKLPGRGFALAATPGIDLHVIHLVRDPRAVVWSMSKRIAREVERGVQKEIRPKLAAYVALRWLLVNRAAERLCRLVGPERSTRVRYEDLVADPAGTIAGVLGPWREGERSPAAVHGSDGVLHPAHQVAGSRHRMQESLVIRADEVWRDEMPMGRQRLVGLLTGAMLRRYGYLAQVAPVPAERLAVRA